MLPADQQQGHPPKLSKSEQEKICAEAARRYVQGLDEDKLTLTPFDAPE